LCRINAMAAVKMCWCGDDRAINIGFDILKIVKIPHIGIFV
jgi:hypothetical protein